MTNLIKLALIHPNNIELDCNVWLCPDDILLIQEATSLDRKQRDEIRCLITLKNNGILGTNIKPTEVIELCKEIHV